MSPKIQYGLQVLLNECGRGQSHAPIARNENEKFGNVLNYEIYKCFCQSLTNKVKALTV